MGASGTRFLFARIVLELVLGRRQQQCMLVGGLIACAQCAFGQARADSSASARSLVRSWQGAYDCLLQPLGLFCACRQARHSLRLRLRHLLVVQPCSAVPSHALLSALLQPRVH